jgi:hypothetical protein
MPSYTILQQLLSFFSDKDVDLMKSYISKIQQLEGELMRQNFSNGCRHGLHDQLTMERDILLNDLGSEGEVGTPDASSKSPIDFLKALREVPCSVILDPFQ